MNTYWEYCEALWDVCLSVFVFTKKKKIQKISFYFPFRKHGASKFKKSAKEKTKFKQLLLQQPRQLLPQQLELASELSSSSSYSSQFWQLLVSVYWNFFLHFIQNNSFRKMYNKKKSLKTKTMVCQGINLYVAKGLQIKFFSKKLIKFI